MQAAIDVIDVEEFHENLQRQSIDDLKRKNKKLKEENQKLDTKINHLHRANDALSRKLFEQDQRCIELARRLGFESMESAEASIISEDLWVPGRPAALLEARDRILLLEDELAKHLTAGEEAQAVIAETKEKLEEKNRHLDEVLEDIRRIREERDFARQEAEGQAMEASKWRMELQATLPEIQSLIRKQQEDNKASLRPRLTDSTEEEKTTPERLAHNPSSLCGVPNIPSLSIHTSSSSLIVASEAQRYKQQFDLLEARYEALRETKEKISKKFCEQLVRWKKFKHWLAMEEMQDGCKTTLRHRFAKRRKVMEKIGPQMVLPEELCDNINAAVQDGLAGGPEVKLNDPLDGGSALNDAGATDQSHHHSAPIPLLSPVKSDPRDFLNSLLNTPHFEEILTQPSIAPTSQHSRTTDHTPTRRPFSISQDTFKFGNDIPMSQQSLTQPSSTPSLSPAPVRSLENMLHSTKEVARPKVFVVDSPVREVTTKEREELVIKIEETPQQNTTDQHIPSTLTVTETPTRVKTPRTSAKRWFQRHSTKNVQPISEPPPISRLRFPSPVHAQAIRRTRTSFVTDTPHRTNASPLRRHHHSSPDSPHMQRMNKRKREAVEIEVSDDGDESDPFGAGPSRVRATALQTRDEKLARLKTLTKMPHNAYMLEYMQFKGRGRYSNANESARKTINGKFKIDPDKNDGLHVQYDAVVRNKDGRRRLEAGDCECCRDYYEAIGPLPPRLQAPLWKSPPSDKNQHATRPCRYENNHILNKTSPTTRTHTKAVEDRKHSISKHRHVWAPPKTPPDFWKIEFPDTPTVNDINRRADEMHAHKLNRVEVETNSINGRYRKRT